MQLESLPTEIISDILSELDLSSLIIVSCLSRRLRAVASNSSLNPWRKPILRNLREGAYEPCLKNLSVRSTVPRQNWIEILSLARTEFILFEATLPNLKAYEWEECFRRRFLPGWQKWKKDGSQWKATFIKTLHRIWHRSHTFCTSDEAWTKYIVLNRNGSINELESSSRNFDPLRIFNQMKVHNSLTHLETRIRVSSYHTPMVITPFNDVAKLVVEFADVRILAFGVLNQPKTILLNDNAHALLHPRGIERDISSEYRRQANISSMASNKYDWASPTYSRLTHPLPSPSHANYPFHTSSGKDKRWIGSGELEEDGLRWVGGLMLTAQLIGPFTHENFLEGPPLQDMDLIAGMRRSQYASFCLEDFRTIAPWMENKLNKIIYGPGLGN